MTIVTKVHELLSEVEFRSLLAYHRLSNDQRLTAMEEQPDDEFRFHLSYFTEALRFDQSGIYIEFLKWYLSVLKSRNIPAEQLHFHQSVIKQAIAETQNSTLKLKAENLFDEATIVYKEQLQLEESCFRSDNPLQQEGLMYLHFLLNGKRTEANSLIIQLYKQGVTLKELYLNIFQQSQYEVGRLWQLNKISVAQEHYCTAATQWIISGLYPYLFGAAKSDKNVVALTIGGELHEMGIRMVADFFELHGWNSFYLGSNLPIEDIKLALNLYHAHVLAVSITLSNHLHQLKELIDAIKSESTLNHVKIMIGGYPFIQTKGLWEKLGADGFARNAEEAVLTAEKLIEYTN